MNILPIKLDDPNNQCAKKNTTGQLLAFLKRCTSHLNKSSIFFLYFRLVSEFFLQRDKNLTFRNKGTAWGDGFMAQRMLMPSVENGEGSSAQWAQWVWVSLSSVGGCKKPSDPAWGRVLCLVGPDLLMGWRLSHTQQLLVKIKGPWGVPVVAQK